MARRTSQKGTFPRKIERGVEYYSALVTVGASDDSDGALVVVRVVSWQNRSGRYGVPRIYIQSVLSGDGDNARYGKATGTSLEVAESDEYAAALKVLAEATEEWAGSDEDDSPKGKGGKAGGTQHRLSETDAAIAELREQMSTIAAALQGLAAPKGRSRAAK